MKKKTISEIELSNLLDLLDEYTDYLTEVVSKSCKIKEDTETSKTIIRKYAKQIGPVVECICSSE